MVGGLLDEQDWDPDSIAPFTGGGWSTSDAVAPSAGGGGRWDDVPKEESGFFDRLLSKDTWTPPKDGSPSFIERLGLSLGGGVDTEGMTPAQQTTAGRRALLQFGLQMLSQSGYTTTPVTTGQALAHGLSGAAASNLLSEKNAFDRGTTLQRLAISRGTQQDLSVLRRAQLLEAYQKLQDAKVKTEKDVEAGRAIERELGIGAGGGGGDGGGTAAPSLPPYIAPNLPEGVSSEEDQIVRTVWGEARGETPEGQRAVAAVIKNRAAQSGRSVQDVIFQPNQFEPWNNPKIRADLEKLDPSSADYQRILRSVREGGDPTGGATHFYSPTGQTALGRPAPDWASGQQAQTIGGHQFYRLGYPGPGGAPGGPAGTLVAGPGAGTGGATTAAPAVTTGAPGAAAPPVAPNPVRVPPTDTSDIDRRLAEVDATRRKELAAAYNSTDRAAGMKAATEKAQTARDALAKERSDRLAKDREEQRKLDADWTKTQAEIAEKERVRLAGIEEERAKEEREHQRQVELERLKQEGAKRHDFDTASLQIDTDRLKKSATAGDQARELRNHFEAMRLLLPHLGGSNALVSKYPEIVGAMQTIGLGDKAQKEQWTNQTAFKQLVDQVAGTLRPIGSGALSDREMEQYRQAFPSLAQTPTGRAITLGILQTAANRKIQEDEFRQSYFQRNKTTEGASRQMDLPVNPDDPAKGGLGPMIQRPPKLTGNAEVDNAAATAYITERRRHAFEPFKLLQDDPKTGRPREIWAMFDDSGKAITEGMP